MSLRLRNTLGRREERFVPRSPGTVKLYVCGPTVHDDPHPGHARSAVAFDAIARYLEAVGHRVIHVRNVTDVDDKIIRKAREENRDYRVLAEEYARRDHAVMERLNVREPDFAPRVSEYIGPIREFVAALIQRGHAYAAESETASANGSSGRDVRFAVGTFPDYGRLSGRSLRDAASDPADFARSDPSDASGRSQAAGRRHPADFVLWKAAKPGEPAWPSPWGPGRPGWHIECSAMAACLLGASFDIHGGGSDLIFPHHENEIAQSQCRFGRPPAAYWLHNGLVSVGGQKMSKSLGNGGRLAALLDEFSPDAVRLFLLSKRYRHPLEFSAAGMAASARASARLRRFFDATSRPAEDPEPGAVPESPIRERFRTAMDDDFNFPAALSVVFAGIKTARALESRARAGSSDAARQAVRLRRDLAWMGRDVLGFRLGADPADETRRRRDGAFRSSK